MKSHYLCMQFSFCAQYNTLIMDYSSMYHYLYNICYIYWLIVACTALVCYYFEIKVLCPVLLALFLCCNAALTKPGKIYGMIFFIKSTGK